MKKEKDEIQFIGKSLYFPLRKILVLADLHIGWEELLNSQGVFMPRSQFKEIMKDLEDIFNEVGKMNEDEKDKRTRKLNEILVVGDLKHEFGQISSQEWRETKEVLELFKKKAKKVVLVKGNHDNILEPIAKRKELKIKDFYIKDEICFLHGNKMFPDCLNKKIKMLVIGHRHPAVVLADKYKREKYKCFLAGKWKNKEVIILPSFFPFIEGSDVVENGCNKLFVDEKSLRNFEVWVVGDKVYRFGKLRGVI